MSPTRDYSGSFDEFVDQPQHDHEHDVKANGSAAEGKAKADGNGSLSEDEPRPPAFTDEALALSFAEQHVSDLRYVAKWSSWMRYDGSRWQSDDTLHTFDQARRICRAATTQCDKPAVAAVIASAKTVAAVEQLAKADRRHAATVLQWDTNPWLLNTGDENEQHR